MEARKMMGFVSPGDAKVSVRTGDWGAMRLALWRSRVAWEITARAAAEILAGCHHMVGCPGAEDDSVSCLATCVDREARMSALVILNAAQRFAPFDARRPAEGPYFAPSREYFSEVLSDLAVAQTENEVLREALRAAKVPVPQPSTSETNPELPMRPVPPPQIELEESSE